MGAALATRRIDATSTTHWPLLRAYMGHSLRPLGECASIFLGRNENSEHDEEDDENDEADTGYLPSVYPRYLTLDNFEEIFGLLVADAQPHFAFFQHVGSSTVCAHHVFCCLAVLAKADLHAKVLFLLGLYTTDAHGQLPTERRRMLLRDFLSAVPRVFSLTEPIEGAVVSFLEKELLSREEPSLGSCRELYDYCFTTARISGFLHEIQSAVNELALVRDKDTSIVLHPIATKPGTEGGRLKLLNRGATMRQLTHEALLWSMRARDLQWFWRQDHVRLPDETLVCDALRAMKDQQNASAFVVVTSLSASCAGYLTLDDFLHFFVDLLPDEAASTPSMGEYMRVQVAKAGQLFAHASLRAVLASVQDTVKPRSDCTRSHASTSRYQTVADDECLFNVILRLACGAHAVAVLTRLSATGSSDSSSLTADPLLGRVSVFDILEWLCEDVSLLNGKEQFAVASFPGFYSTPAAFTAVQPDSSYSQPRPWLLDAVVAMRTQRTTCVLVSSVTSNPESSQQDVYLLSAESIREVFASDVNVENVSFEDHARFPTPVDALTPLHVLLTRRPRAFALARFVQSEDSLANVVHKMVATQSRHLYIKDPLSETVQGVIRATDILRLLLQEQHRQPRNA